ncbi:flagellar filament capping protein FliD [Pseudomonas umsongensis]|jgi:flagellar hook-associated protein 2|uniref:flagellar filament capping protein FliD n=1 Tax=Pseudomonas umsongensis TaxID=198618 RepID=UPI0015BFD363|nr:flagellar filament capping protein FliD [Pseudomonas umsongensis]NWL21821.1 flagellar cap protein FliD [Pseudomonas umsongensis]
MAGSTVSGIGSNIDTQAIVKSLVDAEKVPKQTQINTQTLKATTTLSSIGKIQAALDAFRGALTTMSTGSSFTGLTGSSSDEKVATMTSGDGASTGSFKLVVTQLASASKLSTRTFVGGASSVVNAGASPTTLTITQSGKNYDLSVPVGATLQQVRDSINTQFSTAGLSANILTDASGSRLVLTSTNGGVGSDLTMSGNSGINTGSTVVEVPKNAKYTIDGIAMESKTNTIAEAVSGVSIKLLSISPTASGATEPTATTIAVSTNNAVMKSGVKGFVDTYNALIKAISAETKVTMNADGTPTAGALTGDASMRTLISSVRSELNAMSGTGTFKSLAQFGISTDSSSGLLTLDDKKWDKAMATNAADLGSIFNGKDGLLARLTTATDGYAKASTGTLAERSKSLSESLTDLKKQQDTLDERMTLLQASLSAKYNAMDSLVAKLRAQSDSIMTTLNALNNPKDN